MTTTSGQRPGDQTSMSAGSPTRRAAVGITKRADHQDATYSDDDSAVGPVVSTAARILVVACRRGDHGSRRNVVVGRARRRRSIRFVDDTLRLHPGSGFSRPSRSTSDSAGCCRCPANRRRRYRADHGTGHDCGLLVQPGRGHVWWPTSDGPRRNSDRSKCAESVRGDCSSIGQSGNLPLRAGL